MSEDIAVATALLIAEGLAEPIEEGGPEGLKITPKGYGKCYKLWMAIKGEDRILIALFLRIVRII